MHHSSIVLILASLLALDGCGRLSEKTGSAAMQAGQPTAQTVRQNQQTANAMPAFSSDDEADARRGLIAAASGKILNAQGDVIRDFGAYQFLQNAAPPTANPSLWKHAQLNAGAGLYQVCDGIYQVRGFDIANMSIIQGKSGWIIVDPLTAKESAAAAIAFARQHLGQHAISAIIFTHSHADHFGGVLGVISAEEAAQRHIPVIAPEGFMEEATSENVLAGTAMARRSAYQFGKDLPRSASGNIDTGLGKDVVYGQIGILPPTMLISQPEQALDVDGLHFVFYNVPGAEAPAELTFAIPEKKAFAGAEILAQTMHNLLPVRGAKVRDSQHWAAYLDQALAHSEGAEVCFLQHNWPVWGAARIATFIRNQRDTYQFMHDQTVRLMNAGLTANEIADQVHLPPALNQFMASRGYYGDLRHNVKAIYQFYLGIYDGNPAHLDPLPTSELAKHMVELAGGVGKAMTAARNAYDQGEYRWAAELLNHIVVATHGDQRAKELLASTYEQLGYVAESATWRNSYLTAAQELRQGTPEKGISKALLLDMLAQTPTPRFLEAMAASLNAQEAEGKHLRLNLILSDVNESYVLDINNSVLHHRAAAPADDANASLKLSKALFLKVIAGTVKIKDLVDSNDLHVEGSKLDLLRFLGLFDKAPGNFAIVTR